MGYLIDYDKIIKGMMGSSKLHDLWHKYAIKNAYANDILLDNILQLLYDKLCLMGSFTARN